MKFKSEADSQFSHPRVVNEMNCPQGVRCGLGVEDVTGLRAAFSGWGARGWALKAEGILMCRVGYIKAQGQEKREWAGLLAGGP